MSHRFHQPNIMTSDSRGTESHFQWRSMKYLECNNTFSFSNLMDSYEQAISKLYFHKVGLGIYSFPFISQFWRRMTLGSVIGSHMHFFPQILEHRIKILCQRFFCTNIQRYRKTATESTGQNRWRIV